MIHLDLESFRLVLLGTDLLFFLLLGSGAAFLFYASRRGTYRAAWRRLRSRRLPLVCMGICLLYAGVALLDSVHLQRRAVHAEGKARITAQGRAAYDNEILSLLDLLCARLRTSTERTFSAPFATHQFVRENGETEDGQPVRGFPRLQHGGAHLEDPGRKGEDLAGLAFRSLGLGLALGAGLLAACLLAGRLLPRRRATAGPAPPAGRAGLGAGLFLAVTAVIVTVAAVFSARYHVLGTDQVGLDILYRSLKGARVGLILGTVTTLIATPLAILFGIAAAYLGGRIDDLVQYLYTTVDSIPDILRIAAVMLIVTALTAEAHSTVAADQRLLWLCVALGVGSWTGLCRMLRGETLKVREMEFVQAAEAVGTHRLRIMFRHILPNVMHIVLITVILRFSGLVLAEAVLAYVGIGVDPSMESWGNMINAARLELSRDPPVWWNLTAAFVFMFGLVLPANIFGDAVRDALDPKLKSG